MMQMWLCTAELSGIILTCEAIASVCKKKLCERNEKDD